MTWRLLLSIALLVSLLPISLSAETPEEAASLRDPPKLTITHARLTSSPDQPLSRAELASILAEGFDLPKTDKDYYGDDDGHRHESAINRLAAAGLGSECESKDGTSFCPDAKTTRSEIALILARGLVQSMADVLPIGLDVFEGAIENAVTAGVTGDCARHSRAICPNEHVSRSELAIILIRVLNIWLAQSAGHPADDQPSEPPATDPGDGGGQPGGDPAEPDPNQNDPGGDDGSTQDPPPPPSTSEGTLTGTVCPCTVTGTVELKGNIELAGDLMVMGGTLIARPGVDLDGNGFQIMFMNGAKADFQGTKVFTWSGDGTNANVTRDVNFRNLRRIMFHEGAGVSTLKYIAVHNSGTEGVLGDYPLHWHQNKDTTRGTVVEGVAVVGGKNHAYVPHASHGIYFKDTIAKNTLEEAYWWDTPAHDPCPDISIHPRFCEANNSNDITFDHALVDGVDTKRQFKYRIAGFLLGAGSGNRIFNSVSRNITSGTQCGAFAWPEHAAGNSGGSIWQFKDNYADAGACSRGIFVWQNHSELHVIADFDSPDGIEHGAYINFYRYDNVDVSWFDAHALGFEIRNSSIGDLTKDGHPLGRPEPMTIVNTTMTSFTLDDGDGVGDPQPGNYVLVDVNIACDDLILEDVHPQSTLTIDGVACDIHG